VGEHRPRGCAEGCCCCFVSGTQKHLSLSYKIRRHLQRSLLSFRRAANLLQVPLFLAVLSEGTNGRKQQNLRCLTHCIFVSRRSDPGRLLRQRKVLLFRENQPKFAKWQRIGCLFVENTQSLFEKGKTDVQGAENVKVKQIDMAQMSNCDKIKIDMHFRVTIIRIVQQQ
jgi:hypothetical protein